MKTNISPKNKAREHFVSSLWIGSIWVAILWAIHLLNLWGDLDLATWGIYPQRVSGLVGIVFSPWIHSLEHSHLISNSIPLLVLSSAIIFFYKDISFKVFGIIYIVGGLGVWFIGQQAYHIGASGLIYGMAAFMFFIGVFQRNRSALGISLIVTFLYGGMVWGLLPIQEGVSWESHLFGAIAGCAAAFIYRQTKGSEFIKEEVPILRDTERDGSIPWDYKKIIPPPEGYEYPEDQSY